MSVKENSARKKRPESCMFLLIRQTNYLNDFNSFFLELRADPMKTINTVWIWEAMILALLACSAAVLGNHYVIIT